MKTLLFLLIFLLSTGGWLLYEKDMKQDLEIDDLRLRLNQAKIPLVR